MMYIGCIWDVYYDDYNVYVRGHDHEIQHLHASSGQLGSSTYAAVVYVGGQVLWESTVFDLA